LRRRRRCCSRNTAEIAWLKHAPADGVAQWALTALGRDRVEELCCAMAAAFQAGMEPEPVPEPEPTVAPTKAEIEDLRVWAKTIEFERLLKHAVAQGYSGHACEAWMRKFVEKGTLGSVYLRRVLAQVRADLTGDA
jgi:hypothetical protein